jgi:hypothetical protein
MRHLKPRKPVINVNGKTYELVFSLDVIDEIQDKTTLPVTEIILMLMDFKTRNLAIKVIMKCLIGQDLELQESELENYSILLINTYIEQLKCKEIKGLQRQETPNGEYEFVDIERWFYIGTVVLNYPEDRVWKMTLGELRTLHNEHAAYNGWIKEEKEESLLNL